MNHLFYGDCLSIILNELQLDSVDLIYLDPPFNSNRSYNAIYKDHTGRPLPDQIEAFCDTWELDAERLNIVQRMPVLMREAGVDDDVAEFWRLWMNALRRTNPKLLAYLTYMAQRLLKMSAVLKPTGSIYLHCDPTACHYLKILMDSIFGHKNFMNEIVWKRYAVHSLASKGFDTVSDLILIYAKNIDHVLFNKTYGNPSQNELNEKFPHTEKETGRKYQHAALEKSSNRSSAGEERVICGRRVTTKIGWIWSQKTFDERLEKNPRLIYWTRHGRPRYKIYQDEYEGIPLGNIWTDIPYLSSNDAERLGYDTQKPVALLERIIKTGSNKGDMVFDPFCGCGTTLEAANKLGRQWVGCDIAIHAIKRVVKRRLERNLKLIENTDFSITGIPKNMEGAQDLWNRDKYHFQKWAVEQVDGFVTSNKTNDRGIDGRLYFPGKEGEQLQSMIIEVKGGENVTIADLRAVRGVLDREEAEMAGLIIMHPLTDRKMTNFKEEMASAGILNFLGKEYPVMQILTVQEIFDGKRFNTPYVATREYGQIQLEELDE